MKLKLLSALFAVLLLLGCVLTVAAENDPPAGGEGSEATTTTESTTTTTEATTTTTESITTTTESVTTTTEATTTTTESVTSSSASSSSSSSTGATTTTGGTTTTQSGGTTTPSGTTASASGSTTTTNTTVTTTTTVPTLPPFVDTEIVDRIPLVGEPGEEFSYLQYFHGEMQVNSSDFGWTDGKVGYAMILDGENNYLRFAPETFETLSSFTLTAFINWQGGASGQKLFTLSQNDYLYLEVSPYVSDPANGIDGFYVEGQGSDMTPVSLYKPVRNDTTFRPKENEWYHLAVVVTPVDISLYVNGNLYLSKETTVPLTDMQFSRFLIGGGFYGDPLLNAMLDEVYLYPEALQREHIALLSAGIDPSVGGNLPTQDPYRPTAPSTSTTKKTTVTGPTNKNEKDDDTLFGLPKAMILIPGGVLLVVVVLSILLSIKKEDPTDEEPTALEEPETPVDDEEIEPLIAPTEETPEETDGVPQDGTEEEQV